ncbi:hypothetical protein IE81DRAFT_368630 [Ceraceosorus guamensis]|uniref:F-box domain-containing protein n=1 Tax=Ceraceosorus guamensis TaxID=1522189 RepID=A0A316VUU1_9BASI|nr:hypothetical protein IE81DRAFT_368630 [Ceraceosorus guamensis]PWN40041.1 hypothetical protein IE81DRAFT_368630 [Ceraceosorus guamensis]
MSSHFRMSDLPAETRSHLMTLVDAKTIIRSRRISRGWRAWFDATQEIWRSIAVQWAIISDVHAPFPTGDRRHTQGFTAIADAATASATGYFSAQTSYKVLCDEYRALSLAWSTSGALQARSPDAQGSSRACSHFRTLAWPSEARIVETNRCGSLTILLAWPSQHEPDYSIVELQIAPTTDNEPAFQSLQQLSDSKLLLQCGDMPAHTRLQSHHFTDGDHQFVVEEDADTCILKDYKLQHDKSYVVCGSLSFSPTSFTGIPIAMQVRWPMCVIVLQNQPADEEVRTRSTRICYWNLQTRATIRTVEIEDTPSCVETIDFDLEANLFVLGLEDRVHIYSANDGRLVSDTVCHPFDFQIKDEDVLSKGLLDQASTLLVSSQIYICTASLTDYKQGFKQAAIPLRWQSVEGTSLNPSYMRTE